MKKIIFLLAMSLMTATSYNQSSRRAANTDNTAQKQENERKAKASTATPNNPQERRASPNTNHTPANQRPSQERTNTKPQSTPTNVNNDSRRNEDRGRRESTQPARTEVTSTPERHANTYNSYQNRSVPEVNQSVSVNRTYVNHNAGREFESQRIYRERHEAMHHYDRPPVRREYREHYVYRAPVELNIYWTPVLYRHYLRIYPMVDWDYPIGYRIESIPAYDAEHYKGEVMTVYGQINEVFYSRATDEYFLYSGPYYPYQDFTIVMPGWIARQYSIRPSIFFDNQNLAVTGLITTFEGEPEVVVKESFQINLY